MRRGLVFACLFVAFLVMGGILLTRTFASSSDFVIIPEPSFAEIDEYQPDISAMTEHYTGLFEGRTHREVTSMLEDAGLGYFFPESDLLSFSVRKNFPTRLASYSVGIALGFEGGIFADVRNIESRGLLAL